MGPINTFSLDAVKFVFPPDTNGGVSAGSLVYGSLSFPQLLLTHAIAAVTGMPLEQARAIAYGS